MHADIFPEPTEFRPERWLQGGKKLDKYLVSFGKGTRQCLGMKYDISVPVLIDAHVLCLCRLRLADIKSSLAQAELHITLSTIVQRYDWEMYETTLDDIICKHDFFVAVADLKSKGVRARILHARPNWVATRHTAPTAQSLPVDYDKAVGFPPVSLIDRRVPWKQL